MSFSNRPESGEVPRDWIASEIKDFEVLRRCGIHPWERHSERPNLLRVSIRMYAEYIVGRDIQIDYDPIRGALQKWPAMPHADTLEELSLELFEIAFDNSSVDACWIKISKPLIFAEASEAGIEIFRRRP